MCGQPHAGGTCTGVGWGGGSPCSRTGSPGGAGGVKGSVGRRKDVDEDGLTALLLRLYGVAQCCETVPMRHMACLVTRFRSEL